MSQTQTSKMNQNLSKRGESFVYEGQHARILNLDESHINLDGSEGNAGGWPVMQYANPNLPNADTARSKTSNACTIVWGSNADGELIPPHFQLPSKAKRNNHKFNMEILDNMQIVRVKIGHYITQKAPLTLRRVE
jgi:hypothetical protein